MTENECLVNRIDALMAAVSGRAAVSAWLHKCVQGEETAGRLAERALACLGCHLEEKEVWVACFGGWQEKKRKAR